MALINSTQDFPIMGNSNFMRITWSNMQNGDSGEPFVIASYADRSVQVVGTFGASGSVAIRGSNDGVNYNSLTDPQGNDIAFNSSKIEAVTELVQSIRPEVVSGDGSTSVTVVMLVRK